jgi:hypothetical protein
VDEVVGEASVVLVVAGALMTCPLLPNAPKSSQFGLAATRKRQSALGVAAVHTRIAPQSFRPAISGSLDGMHLNRQVFDARLHDLLVSTIAELDCVGVSARFESGT